MSTAEQRSATVAGALAAGANKKGIDAAVTSAGGSLVVHSPGATDQSRAAAGDIIRAARGTAPIVVDVDGGVVRLQPVTVNDTTSVVEAFVPQSELTEGTARDWWILLGIALGLVVGSVIVVDRLARGAVASVRNLVQAALAVGGGDLGVRIQPSGPRELAEAGYAFNRMADRLITSRTSERELVADLSHRLRTPLTALRIDVESVSDPSARTRLLTDLEAVDRTVDAVIHDANRPVREGVAVTCDATEVAAERIEFWGILAEDEGRRVHIDIPAAPVPVRVERSDLAACLDALIGNVFRHTPEGTDFAVTLRPGPAGGGRLVITDCGPGLPGALVQRRGVSGTGSTGLGLDIAWQIVVGRHRGEIRLESTPGNTRFQVVLPIQQA